MLAKASAIGLVICMVIQQTGFAQVAGQLGVPAYLRNLAPVADQFRPVHLRAVSPDQSFTKFDLLLDKGDAKQLTDEQAQDAAGKLMEYFRTGLQLPNSMFWVNLRPDAADNIIDPYLEKTDIGKIFLDADLQLKKDLARLTNPDTKEGREYWDKLYQKAESLFGSNDLEIPTVTRPWIVPDEIVVGETANTAYVYKATLKVMLEQDYLKDATAYNFSDPRLKELNAYSSELIRSAIIPKLIREVNASKRYAALRQVYYSLILAQWFKTKFEQGSGIDRKDLSGLTSASAWSKDTYYNAYKRSFSEGEYKKEQSVQTSSGITVRTYVSGGIAAIMSGQIATVNAIPKTDSTIKVAIDIDGGSFTITTGTYKPESGDPEKTIRTYQSMYEYLYNMKLPRDQMRVSQPQDVPLRDLIRSQPAITAVELAERLSAARTEKPSPIVVWKDEGGLYIVDGHHRAAAALLRNEENIRAYIIEPPQRAKGLLAMTKLWPDELSETGIEHITIKYEDDLKQPRAVRLDQISGYKVNKGSVTFLFSAKKDGGKKEETEAPTQGERIIDLLWQNFVFTKRSTVFKDLTDAEVRWMRFGQVDPNCLVSFRQHIQKTFLNEPGRYNTIALKQLIYEKDLGMHIVYRVLKPLFYSSAEQRRILEIIREFPYFAGAVLTVEMIEKQLKKEHLPADAYAAVDITALARLQLISVEKGKPGAWAITGLLKNDKTGEYNFEQFFSEFKPSAQAKDNLKKTMTEYFIEKMNAGSVRADDRAGIKDVLRDMSKDDISRRLGRPVKRNAFGSSKNQIARMLRDMPVEQIQLLLDEGSGVLYRNKKSASGTKPNDGGKNDPIRLGYQFPDETLSVSQDGTVSMQHSGKRHVVTPEGKWLIAMNLEKSLSRPMGFAEVHAMLTAMENYVKADSPGSDIVKTAIDIKVDQLIKKLLPGEQKIPDKTIEPVNAIEQEASLEQEPQRLRRGRGTLQPIGAQRPFINLWQAYELKVKNGGSSDAPTLTPGHIANFKQFVRDRINVMTKAEFVKKLSSKKEGADVSSGVIYHFLQLFFSPKKEQKALACLIYNHDYKSEPLTVPSLSKSTGITPAATLLYVHMLEVAGAIKLKYNDENNKLTVYSLDKNVLEAWLKDHIIIDENGARPADGGADRKVAGIDMRVLASTSSLPAAISKKRMAAETMSSEALQNEWRGIRENIKTGNIPYERVADYVAQCRAQDAKKELAFAVDYIAEILRMEESCGVPTAPQMKDILLCIK
jgi:hypothetical protein